MLHFLIKFIFPLIKSFYKDLAKKRKRKSFYKDYDRPGPYNSTNKITIQSGKPIKCCFQHGAKERVPYVKLRFEHMILSFEILFLLLQTCVYMIKFVEAAFKFSRLYIYIYIYIYIKVLVLKKRL